MRPPYPHLAPCRKLRPLGVVASLGLLLAACSTTPLPAPVTGSAPLPIAGYDWHLNQDTQEASLTYGMANTDDVAFDLSCQPGSGRLALLHSAPADSPLHIQLQSGTETKTYHAKAEPSALTEGLDLTATAPSSDPVFQSFRSLGWIAVLTAKGREAYVATSERLPDVQRFFSQCDATP